MSGTTENIAVAPEAAPAEMVVKYRLRYTLDNRKILGMLLLSLIILVTVLGAFVFVLLTTRHPPLHFKLNDQLQIIDPVPLDQEGISKPALLNWVNEMATIAFSFNYSNIEKQQSRLVPYFSKLAMKQYTDLLTQDEDFTIIKDKQYVVSIRPTAAPEILTAKNFKGRYAWQIRVLAIIKFSNSATSSSQAVTMDFLVWRVPETQSALGIIVASFNRKVTGRYSVQGTKHAF